MGDISTNFNRSEFSCHCGCGFDAVDAELIEVLEGARQWFNSPIKIVSGCRCEDHNRAVGGASKSQHRFAKAADIQVTGKRPSEVAEYFERVYTDKFGVGRYSGWVHIDVRKVKSRWDKVGGDT